MLQALERAVDRLDGLDPVADALQQLVGTALERGGSQAKLAKDAKIEPQ